MPMSRTLLGRNDGSIVHVGCTGSMDLEGEPAGDLAKGLADGPALEELNKE